MFKMAATVLVSLTMKYLCVAMISKGPVSVPNLQQRGALIHSRDLLATCFSIIPPELLHILLRLSIAP